MTIASDAHRWPAEGLTRVPYWAYSDSSIYEEEQARIFRGPTWQFLCLEAELPTSNTYRRSGLGAMPVVVTRDKDGELHAFENRCAHRGSLLVLNESGEARDIICIYHNWSYDLCGNLTGVAFRKGLRGKGGMPPECRPEAYGPRKLRVETLAGLVFGTLSADTPPLAQYLGAEIVPRIRRVMRAPVKVLGGYSQTLPSNWKLYMENVKDSYHASLLHTLFPTFRLNRLSQQGGIVVSDSGGHHVSYSLAADSGGKEYEQAGMRAAQEGFGLEAPQLLEAID
jgi:phenylpropionate dioxygenase-like ring-hydroxylating dioxygenase large terminal subunit